METSSDAKVRQLYDDFADHYSEMMDSEIDLPIYAELLSRLSERISTIQGPVVDTSCGSGHMLARYHERYDPGRLLIGIDLSPRMVAIAGARVGANAEILVGDMRSLEGVAPSSAAAVLSFFAIQHIDPDDALKALREWRRALCPGGALSIAVWEGAGAVDYGGRFDAVARRYTEAEVSNWALEAGFSVDRCVVEPVEGFPMDALYLEGSKAASI